MAYTAGAFQVAATGFGAVGSVLLTCSGVDARQGVALQVSGQPDTCESGEGVGGGDNVGKSEPTSG